MTEATYWLYQRGVKGATDNCFFFESWFYSKRSAGADMDVGVDMVSVVKINKKGFSKDAIEKTTKDWPGGFYLMLKIKYVVPGDRPIIAIGCKYKAKKVIYLIATEDAGITKFGIPYLYKYPENFYNVSIHPVSHPLVMSRLFGSFNEFYPNKKPRQYGLALEKYWVNQCGWIHLCMTVAMGMTIYNFWNVYFNRVNIYHYEKLMGTR